MSAAPRSSPPPNGRSGFVYRGKSIPELAGTYVFGDFPQSFAGPAGRVFHLTDGGGIAALPAPGLFVDGFGQDRRGEMYVMGSQNIAPVGTTGAVLRLVPGG